MKTSYTNLLSPIHLAILDVNPRSEQTHCIVRINVPMKFRGQGFGSKLLKEVIEDADREKITLILDILASGPLNHDDLFQWYNRYGFIKNLDTLVSELIRYPILV